MHVCTYTHTHTHQSAGNPLGNFIMTELQVLSNVVQDLSTIVGCLLTTAVKNVWVWVWVGGWVGGRGEEGAKMSRLQFIKV